MARFSLLLCGAVLAITASLAGADLDAAAVPIADAVAAAVKVETADAKAATTLRGAEPVAIVNALPLVSMDETANSAANANATNTNATAAAGSTPAPTQAPAQPVAPNLHPFIALVMVALVLTVTNNVAGADSIAAISSTAGILTTVFSLVMGLDLKDAVALSVVTITGGNLGTFVDNVREGARDPDARPLIDWDLLLAIQPTLMLGVLFGIFVRHVLLPTWLLSTVLATVLLVCGSLLLQASHRRTEAPLPEGVSINEGTALVVTEEANVAKPPSSGPAPSFSVALHSVPLPKVGALVGVVFAVAVLHAALVVAVPLVLLGYLAYKSYKTTVSTGEIQQLPRVTPSQGELKWTPRMVWLMPILSTLSGLVTGAVGFGSDLIVVPYFVECGLERAVAVATGSTVVLLTCLMTAMECVVIGSVSFTVVILAIGVGFVVKMWGHLALERALSENFNNPSFLPFSFAACTLLAGIALALASIF